MTILGPKCVQVNSFNFRRFQSKLLHDFFAYICFLASIVEDDCSLYFAILVSPIYQCSGRLHQDCTLSLHCSHDRMNSLISVQLFLVPYSLVIPLALLANSAASAGTGSMTFLQTQETSFLYKEFPTFLQIFDFCAIDSKVVFLTKEAANPFMLTLLRLDHECLCCAKNLRTSLFTDHFSFTIRHLFGNIPSNILFRISDFCTHFKSLQLSFYYVKDSEMSQVSFEVLRATCKVISFGIRDIMIGIMTKFS